MINRRKPPDLLGDSSSLTVPQGSEFQHLKDSQDISPLNLNRSICLPLTCFAALIGFFQAASRAGG